MKACLTLFILFTFFTGLYGQNITRNNIYLEAGGACFFYSLNYERLIFKNPKNNLTARVGFMYLNYFNNVERQMTGVPVGISYIHRIKRNFLETGLTFAAIADQYFNMPQDNGESYYADLVLIPALRIGIRHQPAVKGFFWNAALQFMVVMVDDMNNFGPPFEAGFYPFVGLGAGYAF